MKAQDEKDPISERKWPDTLQARVVEPGSPARIHGYEVDSDLADHYSFSQTMFLCLSGELPDDATSKAFDTALQFLAPAPINEAPTHAAMLARLCGARPSGVLATGSVALTEYARATVQEHAALLEWLDGLASEVPTVYLSQNEGDVQARTQLRSAFARAGLMVSALEHSLTRVASTLSALHAIGLRKQEQLETVLVLSRLPALAAEAFASPAGKFNEYPINLPRFTYEGKR